jgi:hypothetical protein
MHSVYMDWYFLFFYLFFICVYGKKKLSNIFALIKTMNNCSDGDNLDVFCEQFNKNWKYLSKLF